MHWGTPAVFRLILCNNFHIGLKENTAAAAALTYSATSVFRLAFSSSTLISATLTAESSSSCSFLSLSWFMICFSKSFTRWSFCVSKCVSCGRCSMEEDEFILVSSREITSLNAKFTQLQTVLTAAGCSPPAPPFSSFASWKLFKKSFRSLLL